MNKLHNKPNKAATSRTKPTKAPKAKKHLAPKKATKRKLTTTARQTPSLSQSTFAAVNASPTLLIPTIATPFLTQTAQFTTPATTSPSTFPSIRQQYQSLHTQRAQNIAFKTTSRLLSQTTPTPTPAATKPTTTESTTDKTTTDKTTTPTPNTETTKANETTPATTGDNATTEEPVKKEGKMKQMYKKYGKLAVYTYLGVYVSTLAALAVGVNFIPGFDAQVPIQAVKDGHHFDRQFEFLERTLQQFPALENFLNTYPKQTANFGAAWCLTKFTEPIRLIVTGLLVPFLHRRKVQKQEAEVKETVEQSKSV